VATKLEEQARFSGTGLANDSNDVAMARSANLPEAVQQVGELGLAAYEGAEPAPTETEARRISLNEPI
jgi:hypothetical protein